MKSAKSSTRWWCSLGSTAADVQAERRSIPIGVVGKVREGKIAEARMFSDPDEALEAAGLPE
jgi:hypothetical protein